MLTAIFQYFFVVISTILAVILPHLFGIINSPLAGAFQYLFVVISTILTGVFSSAMFASITIT